VISAATLNRLLARATEDNRQEPAFFRALLDAKVYAHVPNTDPASRRLRFIQFNHPETGQLILPFFTDEPKARAAVGTSARVVSLRGRVFLEATLGATLMLNPNDEHGTLYPEEIETLLRTGRMARFEKVTVTEGSEPLVGPPTPAPAWLMDVLTTALTGLSFVEVAYMASMHAPDGKGVSSTLLALGTKDGLGERAVHAIITAAQPACREHQFALDIVHFVEPGQRPSWVDAFQFPPIYEKAWGARLMGAQSQTPQ
jgi:hypothetical protein